MPSDATIKRVAIAIHSARIKKEPGLKTTWEDCVEEAKAAYEASLAGKPIYDSREDFSHIDPI